MRDDQQGGVQQHDKAGGGGAAEWRRLYDRKRQVEFKEEVNAEPGDEGDRVEMRRNEKRLVQVTEASFIRLTALYYS